MILHVTHWLPGELADDGTRGDPMPCPDLLTDGEAIRYLRLDESDTKEPKRTLQTYRDEAKLVGVRMGRHIRYRRIDLDAFIDGQKK